MAKHGDGGLAGPPSAAVVEAALSDRIQLPSELSVFRAAYVRDGADLVVRGDGAEVVVRGFFAVDAAPAIVDRAGGLISGEMVAELTGRATAAAAEPPAIGRIETLQGEATVGHADGSVGEAAAGAPVFAGDVVKTAPGSASSVVLADGSVISLGGGSEIVFTEVWFDPTAAIGRIAVTAVGGVFVFVGGSVGRADPQAFTVDTGTASIVLGGAQVGVRVDAAAETTEVIRMEGLADEGGDAVVVHAGDGNLLGLDTPGQLLLLAAGRAPAASFLADLRFIVDHYGEALAVAALGTTNVYGVPPAASAGDDLAAAAEALDDFETAAGGEADGGDDAAPDAFAVSNAGEVFAAAETISIPRAPGLRPLPADGDGGSGIVDHSDVELFLVAYDDPFFSSLTGGQGTVRTNEDTPTSAINVAGLVSDAIGPVTVTSILGVPNDGAPVIGTPLPLPSGAAIILASGNEFIYVPNGQFEYLSPASVAFDWFVFRVSDATGAVMPSLVTVAIEGVNDAPVARDDAATTTQNAATTAFDPLANDSDVDQWDSLSISAVNGIAVGSGGSVPLPSGALVTVLPGGKLSYDPHAAFGPLAAGVAGTDSFHYSVKDFSGATGEATVSVTIIGENDAPAARGDRLTADEDTPRTMSPATLLVNDRDIDGDPMSLSAVGNAVNGSVRIKPDGDVEFTPARDFFGVARFTYTVGDGALADTATVTVDVAPVNDAPIAGADGAVTDEDTPVTVYALANDSDVDNGLDPRTVTVVSLPSIGSVQVDPATGAIRYTPNTDAFGADAFTYAVKDESGALSNPTTVAVTVRPVNDAPRAEADLAVTVEDRVVTLDVLANDSDVDDGIDPTSVFIMDPPANGQVVIVPTSGQIHYVPNPDFFGTDSFTYRVRDGARNEANTGEARIAVTPVNDAPEATDDALAAGASLPIRFGGGDLVANDRDRDPGDQLSVTHINGVAAVPGARVTLASQAVVVVGADGLFTYDANGGFDSLPAGQTRQDTFTYTVADGQGATATASVSVTVLGAGSEIFARADAFTTGEKTPLAIAAAELVANDVPLAAHGALAVTAIDAVGSRGTVALSADGAVITYDPAGEFQALGLGETAVDQFRYTVAAADGTADQAAVTVTVTGVNDAPTAAADAAATDEDAAVAIAVLANDRDPDSSDVLRVVAVNGLAAAIGLPLPLPSGAVATLLADGNIGYRPSAAANALAAGETAADAFTYTLADGRGGTVEATVAVTVAGRNDAPVAAADLFAASEDGPLIVAAPGVLGNDADPDLSDRLTVTAVNGAAADVGRTITLASGARLHMGADGSFTYLPDAAFDRLAAGEEASDSFVYTTGDDRGGFASATVRIAVTGVNDAPDAVDDRLATDEATPIVITRASLFVNDRDPEGDPLAISLVDVGTTRGTVSIDPDGSIRYSPVGAFGGLRQGEIALDAFTYSVTDGAGTDTATVTVEVTGLAAERRIESFEASLGDFDVRGQVARVDRYQEADGPQRLYLPEDGQQFAVITADGRSFGLPGSGLITFLDADTPANRALFTDADRSLPVNGAAMKTTVADLQIGDVISFFAAFDNLDFAQVGKNDLAVLTVDGTAYKLFDGRGVDSPPSLHQGSAPWTLFSFAADRAGSLTLGFAAFDDDPDLAGDPFDSRFLVDDIRVNADLSGYTVAATDPTGVLKTLTPAPPGT
jgi:VCBS repeat-containing protein